MYLIAIGLLLVSTILIPFVNKMTIKRFEDREKRWKKWGNAEADYDEFAGEVIEPGSRRELATNLGQEDENSLEDPYRPPRE
ncbi:MAG: hypothetical protein AAF394_04785 [Planctomycetota bacterium]